MIFVKKALFLLLMPIYLPMSVFINSTYEWWENKKKEDKILFFLLSLIYVPFSLFLWWSFEWWAKLSE